MVCLAENKVQKQSIQRAFAGYFVEEDVRKNSSSGGAFKAIVDAASIYTRFFGAEWKNCIHVVHSVSLKEDAYLQFRKSKYVQSNTVCTYQETKQILDKGEEVVYIGTPCQIAGLKRFLQKESENLLCVDLVCHVVSSNDVLERYYTANEKARYSVVKMDFLEKVQKGENIDSKCVVSHYQNGKKKVIDYEKSGFLRGFANGLFFRPSCSTCPFACAERISDLTIGDAWGMKKKS